MKIRLIAALTFCLCLLSTTVVAAQVDPSIPPEFFNQVGMAAEDIDGLDANPAWHGLGLFSEDSLKIIAATTQDRPAIQYAFGDDPNGTPVFAPDGANPTGSGAMYWHVPTGWERPAEGWGESMAFAQTTSSQISDEETFLLLWMEMDSDYDFASGRQINEGFPLALPGLPVWHSTFAGDTWENANLIPNAIYDNGNLTLDVKKFEEPQAFPLVDVAAFYFRSGNIMAMGVSAPDILALIGPDEVAAADTEVVTDTLLYTGDVQTLPVGDFFENALDEILFEVFWFGWSHITENGQFTPGFIAYLVDRYGPFDAFFALSTASVLPAPPAVIPPTPTPTPVPTEVPTEQPTSVPVEEPTEAPLVNPEPSDGGSLPYLPIGIGFLTVLVAAYFYKKKDPKNDCDDERTAWLAAENSYAEAVDAIEPAEKAIDDAIDKRRDAAKKLREAEADIPPGSDGDSVTDENTGETVTSQDRWMRERYASDEYAAYQSDRNPETARAYEDAMRAADTPEAREARREAADAARVAAVPLSEALDKAREAEREAKSALERRHRDAKSEREFADAAKKRYEECIKAAAEFEEKAKKVRKRYDDTVERDRRRREEGGPGGTPPPAVAPPPEPEINGVCSPIGSTTSTTSTFNGVVIADSETVTFKFTRTHGAFEDDELEGGTNDPLFTMFGSGRGADGGTATFTMPARQAIGLDPSAIASNFDRHQVAARERASSTVTPRMELNISWDHQGVHATCVKTLRCTGSGWVSAGPGNFSEQRQASNTYNKSVTLGGGSPTNDLNRILRTLKNDVDKREELHDFQGACADVQ